MSWTSSEDTSHIMYGGYGYYEPEERRIEERWHTSVPSPVHECTEIGHAKLVAQSFIRREIKEGNF